MGYHQLLSIVLSTIVAAVGLTMGISMFEENDDKFRKDAANVAMLEVASQAVLWSNKPKMMGGGLDAYGSSSFSGVTMQKLGYDHPDVEEGAISLPDGSCITGKAAAAGKSFYIEWYPGEGCHDLEHAQLRLEINGPTLDHIVMVEPADNHEGYAGSNG